MKKKINKKVAGNNTRPKLQSKKEVTPAPSGEPLIEKIPPKEIPTNEIEFSPLNHREFYSENDLKNFADELKVHGIISSLLVRPLPKGRFELVVGERRLRAARIAGLKTIPARVKELTDEQVRELQLSENLQREDPHPLHIARSIGSMQQAGLSSDEIAARLGKSKQFIYCRLKLLNLVEPFQEMFLNNIISTQQALELASISPESQTELFEEQYRNWKSEKNFHLHNLGHYLDQIRCNLTDAPFNTKDKKLLPEAGACTACPSNTATLKLLFPDYAKQAICNNRECFRKKCHAHFQIKLLHAFKEYKPDALLYDRHLPNEILEAIEALPEADKLPTYNPNEVTIYTSPEMPDKEDYTYEWNGDDGEEQEFDEHGYNQAMQEYETDLQEYRKMAVTEEAPGGLLVTEKEVSSVYFRLGKKDSENHRKKTTAKEVQEAIKAKIATPEILQAEIDRINEKEKRAKELDREKVQLKLHETFWEYVSQPGNNTLTDADLIATRFIVYKSLDYSTHCKVDAALFGNKKPTDTDLYEVLAGLSDQQYSQLVRMALAGMSESKYLHNDEAKCLYKLAESAGVEVKNIELEQENKAAERQQKVNERVADLEKRMAGMKAVA